MPYDDQQEQFVWVDEEDKELGIILRSEAHSGGRKIHRAVTVLVFNQDKTKVLWQQRSKYKDINPNKWTCGAGGHVTKGEDYLTAVKKELMEELGISGVKFKGKDKKLFDLGKQREIIAIFEIRVDEGIVLKLDEAEVVGVKWVEVDKLREFVEANDVCNDAREILEILKYI